MVLAFAAALASVLVINRWKSPTGTLEAPKQEMPQADNGFESRPIGNGEFFAQVFKDVKPPVWVGSLLVKEPSTLVQDSLLRLQRWALETQNTALEAWVIGQLAEQKPTEANITEAARNFIFSATQITENAIISSYLYQSGKKMIDRGMKLNDKNIPLRNALITYLSIYENAPMKFLGVLRETLAIDSTNVETHYIHLGLLKKSGQWKKALDKCQKLISLQPQNPEWLFEASDLYGQQGDSVNAKVYLNLAVKARNNQKKQ